MNLSGPFPLVPFSFPLFLDLKSCGMNSFPHIMHLSSSPQKIIHHLSHCRFNLISSGKRAHTSAALVCPGHDSQTSVTPFILLYLCPPYVSPPGGQPATAPQTLRSMEAFITAPQRVQHHGQRHASPPAVQHHGQYLKLSPLRWGFCVKDASS